MGGSRGGRGGRGVLTFGAFVAMDRKHEDRLGHEVRDVPRDAEDLERVREDGATRARPLTFHPESVHIFAVLIQTRVYRIARSRRRRRMMVEAGREIAIARRGWTRFGARGSGVAVGSFVEATREGRAVACTTERPRYHGVYPAF